MHELFLRVLLFSSFTGTMTIKPRLIVFDLDYTLWPFWVDTHVQPPFRESSNGRVVDARGQRVNYYPEVPSVLKKLTREGYDLGVASRTSEIEGAYQLLDVLGWDEYFKYKEIYPGSKVTHFNNFKKKSGIDFKDMIFFDDEERNISDLTRHGVLSILVDNGVTEKVVEDGLREYERKYS